MLPSLLFRVATGSLSTTESHHAAPHGKSCSTAVRRLSSGPVGYSCVAMKTGTSFPSGLAISLLVMAVAASRSFADESFVDVGFLVQQTNYIHLRNPTNREVMTVKEKPGSWPGRCVTSPGPWLIETHFSPNALDRYYWDGTNVYGTIEITGEPAPAMRKAMKDRYGYSVSSLEETQRAGWTHLLITPGANPLEDFGANLPWLAFCSGGYLRQESRLLPAPGDAARHSYFAFGYTDKTVFFKDLLGLPSQVEFYASSRLLSIAPRHATVLRSGKEWAQNALHPKPFLPDKFLGAVYKVLITTNVNGYTVPLKFSYDQYWSGPNGERLLVLSALGTVTNLSRSSPPDFVLASTKRFAVVDYRFRSRSKLVDSISYAITNGVVPSASDASLQTLFKESEAGAAFDPIIKARLGIYGLFAVMLGIPILVSIRQWTNARQTKRAVKT